MQSDATGSANTCIGNFNMNNGSDAVACVAIGVSCLQNSASGVADCIGIGRLVFGNTLTGNNNIGIGLTALSSLTSGSFNVGIGSSPMASQLTGSYNIALGYHALFLQPLMMPISALVMWPGETLQEVPGMHA